MHRIRPLFLLLTIALVISPALAQNDVPTIYIYNNSGTLQFDTGGSDPVVLEEITNHIVEQIGVRPVTIVPPGRGAVATEKLNLLLGSSDPIDIFQTPGPGYWHDYADAIIPINDLLEEYGQNILQVIPENQWAQMTDADGNIMGIPRSTPTSPFITWVRQDWLDELGLEVPTTLEELEATIEAFQAHNPDAFVATRPQDITWSTLGGFTPNGRSNWLDPADGLVKPWVLQPGVDDWLTKLNEWWNAGYFYPETFTNFDAPEVFRTCNLGVWMAWYSRITLITPQIESNCEGIEWARTSIVGPEGYIATSRPQSASAYVVTRKAQNPEAVIKFMDWVFHADTTDNQLTARYGIKGTHWDYQDPDTRTVEVYDSGYVSEFMMPNLNIEIRYSVLDPARAWHLQYLGSTLIDLSDAKRPFDADISYNLSLIADETPYLGDIQRLMDEQTILFITGARPLDQFDDFINELNMAGIGDWVNALTAQYNAFAG